MRCKRASQHLLAVVAVVLAALGGVWSCKSKLSQDEIAATVNGDPISKASYETAVERNLARYRGQSETLPPGIESRIRESVLRRLIDDKMIAQKASGIGVVVTDEQVQAKYDEHKRRFRTEEAFNDYLKRVRNTPESMRADLRRNMLRDQVVEKLSGATSVTDEAMSKYYQQFKARFMRKEQVRVSRILLRKNPGMSADDKAKLEARAKELRAKAAAAGADFAAIAKENSQGPEAVRGGELGWIPRGTKPAAFDKAAFALSKGGVSQAVNTPLGWEIIKVWEKQPERQRTLDEVKENIRATLEARARNEQRINVLRELKKGAEVEQFIKFNRGPATAATRLPKGAGAASAGGAAAAAAPGNSAGTAKPLGGAGRAVPAGGTDAAATK